MTEVVLEVLGPVILAAAVGGWVAHRAGMPVAPLAALTFDVFSPALVFHALVDLRADGSIMVRVVLVVVAGFLAMTLIGLARARAAGRDRVTAAATTLCAAVANNGNMGLPVAALAFGDPGLEIAVVVFVTSSVLTYSAGIVLVSLASGSMRHALTRPLRVPALWAALAALGFAATDVGVPDAMQATTSVLAGAAVPCMLVVLGLQLRAGAGLLDELTDVVGTVVLRLAVSPAIVALLATASGLDGVARRSMIVLGGMPTAVNTTILATQYAARPQLVGRIVVLSTLVSGVTLTVLVAALR